MTYFPDMHSYLHQSSLLIQAYPTARITTKYSLPPKTTTTQPQEPEGKQKKEPSATLTMKTFHPESGICLKYRTDKAQEVGRLMMGLGRLAKGELIEMPSEDAEDKMDVDKVEIKTAAQMTGQQQQPQSQQQQQQGGGKKKKGKK